MYFKFNWPQHKKSSSSKSNNSSIRKSDCAQECWIYVLRAHTFRWSQAASPDPFFPFFLLRWRRKKALFDVDVGRLNPRNPHLASESSPVKNNFFERPVIRTTEPPWASKSKSFLFNLIVAYVNLLVKSCLTSEYKYLSLKSLRISACVMKNFPLLDPLKTFCDVTLNQTKTKWAAFVGHVAQSPLVFAALFTHSCIEGLKSRINRWCQAPTS